MKKNGFTLVELLASIVLLAILATITINVTVRKINESKEKSRQTLLKSIELAAVQYVTNHSDEIENFSNKDFAYITLETLVRNEVFTNSLVDPTTKKALPMSDTVYVTRSANGKISSKYDINQKSKSTLILNGSFNIYVKQNSVFTDPGVVATSSSGASVTATVTGTVDTSTKGTYVITYSHGENSITRNVIVY